jgi:hypothetical protein
MASNLVRRAQQLLGTSTHDRAKQRVAGQLAREFPAYERHEVWGAVGLGPTEPKPPPLYLEHLNPHEVRAKVDRRPDGPPEHPTDADATRALRKAGARRPRRQPPSKPPALVARMRALIDQAEAAGELEPIDPYNVDAETVESIGRITGGRLSDEERGLHERRVRAERDAERAARALERATRQAATAEHLARRARAEERAARRRP